MKFYSSFLILIVLLASSFLPKTQIEINKANINFVFISKNVEGSIADFKTSSKINLQQLEKSTFEGSVSLESLKTGNFLRDWHLMSKKYFHRKKFPRIYFKSTAIVKKENNYQVTGNLTIKGISKEVSLTMKKLPNALQLTGVINTTDWDINIMKKKNENLVRCKIQLFLP